MRCTFITRHSLRLQFICQPRSFAIFRMFQLASERLTKTVAVNLIVILHFIVAAIASSPSAKSTNICSPQLYASLTHVKVVFQNYTSSQCEASITVPANHAVKINPIPFVEVYTRPSKLLWVSCNWSD